MYSIIKNGSEIGLTETPRYVKLQSNGCYALCDKESAQGVCFDGTVYHLSGAPELSGTEDVILTEFDAGARIHEQAQLDYDTLLLDLDYRTTLLEITGGGETA